MMDNIYDYLINAIHNSDFARGAIVASLLAGIWQSVRELFPKIKKRIERKYVYEVVIEQNTELYKSVNHWIYQNHPTQYKKVTATLHEKNISYTQKDDYFLLYYKGRILMISQGREKLESASSLESMFYNRFVIKGFLAKKQITSIMDEILKCHIKINKMNDYMKYNFDSYCWNSEGINNVKRFDNIFFEQKEKLIAEIDRFSSRKKWYLERGIEWYLGILLYGEPGTGKTSIAKAIAQHTKRDLYVLNIASIKNSEFQRAFDRMGDNAVLLIDDIDISLNNRDTSSGDDKGVSISTLLSCLDGSNSRSDLIVIFTTNDVSKLDKALVRSGRMDIKMEIKKPNKAQIRQYLEKYYNEVNLDAEILNYLSMADVQNICKNNDTYIGAVAEINKNYEISKDKAEIKAI